MSTKWKVIELESCESTFNAARKEKPWTMVCATQQTKGRGRFNRNWFGDAGGLWVTYNLPLEKRSDRHWGLLPLVAGVAIYEALKPLRIEGLRLRWPNDVLVERDKLGGILVERPAPDMASIGIGINVFNDVNRISRLTTDKPTRLSDEVYTCPSIAKLRQQLADALANAFSSFVEHGIESLSAQLQEAWGESRPVVAITDTERICGYFTGVESDGSPILRKADGSTITVPGITVNRLKELI